MSGKWFFTTAPDGDVIELRARFEGPGGLIGDAFDEIRPGMLVHGVSFEELKRAGSGVVRVTGPGKARIVRPRLRRGRENL
jgi:hypothetical protein